ncbi:MULTISPECIES: MFS transporter [Burkholderia]|uniref:MFS transporter n=2 Tax=Burkholderia gladioli TaxID=28095 RepID=A0A2A7S5Q7_BURGA|nr:MULTISPECIES: MFS transporter [Burkholderia]MBJ9663050.1 MFS transporter [Burkholderia gladioli]MBU9170744.1 MFS transporter [Burkholderia gladioli]MBU9197590.1 MFS transporter [Burkholderia gladioli]MBU9215624.1 MFS transporter [Burkholderia gladioli]MBU9384228.1 MFS transporter [Burkholderia gladioli]
MLNASTAELPAAAADADSTASSRAIARKAALAAAAGTAIEYYEFGVYGYMAALIGPLFFPADHPTAALLSILAIFGSAFLMRPIGGIVLGRLGDRVGRRAVLLVTVLGMGIATAAVGLLPTAATAGVAAPVALLLARLAQGFFSGAEVTGAATYLAESAPRGRRGFYGAFTPVGVAIGGALAATVCGLTTALVGAEQMHAGGWRIPFLAALPLVLLSALIRKRVDESVAFRQSAARHETVKAPLSELFAHHRAALLKVFLISLGQNAGYWVGFIFMNIYLTSYLKYDKASVFTLMAVISLAMAALMPLWGGLSDRIGRRRVLLVGFAGYIALIFPMMVLMNQQSFALAALAMFVVALPMPAVQSVGYPTYAEQFPTRVRYTGMAFSFNFGAMLGGGVTPYLATALIGSTGNLMSPAFLMVGALVIGGLALLRMRETADAALD